MLIITNCFICGKKATGGYNDNNICEKIYKAYPEKNIEFYGRNICTCNEKVCNEKMRNIFLDLQISDNKYLVKQWIEPCKPYNIPRKNGDIDTGGTVLRDDHYNSNPLDLSNITIPMKWIDRKGDEMNKALSINDFSKHNYHIPLPIIDPDCKLVCMQNKIINIFILNNRCLIDILVANSRPFLDHNSSPLSLIPVELINIIIKHYYEL